MQPITIASYWTLRNLCMRLIFGPKNEFHTKNLSSSEVDNDNAFYLFCCFWCCRLLLLSLSLPPSPAHSMPFQLLSWTDHRAVSQQKSNINALIYAFDVTTIITLIELILKWTCHIFQANHESHTQMLVTKSGQHWRLRMFKHWSIANG